MKLSHEREVHARLTLPLVDHPLDAVVQDQTFNTDVVLRGGGELHGSHAEGGVPINIYNDLVRRADFATNRSRETEAHRLHLLSRFSGKGGPEGRTRHTPNPPEEIIVRGCVQR